MAQTGYTPILIYSSSTASNLPSASNLTNSTLGSELAINITDGKLFYKDNANAVQVIAWKTTPTTAGGTGLTSYTAGDLLYYATGTTLSKLAIGASTTVLTSSGSAPQWTAQSALSVGTAANLLSNATTGVMQITGPAAGTTRVMTIPNANFTAARTDAAQTFSGLQTFGGGISSTGITLTSTGLIISASEVYSELYSSGGVGNNARVRFRAVYTGGGSGYGGSFELESRTSSNVWNTGALTVTDAGNVSTTGNFIVGTSGKGIDFSATAGTGTSELLADYEEGTWTPAVEGSTSAGTGTYGNQLGYYTKVGNIVYFQLWLQVSTHTGTGDTRITGLPFTSKNVFGNGGATLNYAANLNFTANYVAQIQVAQNATYMNLLQYITGGGSGVTTIGIPVDSNMQVQISGFYLV